MSFKRIFISLMIAVMIFTQGCATMPIKGNEKIALPRNRQMPLEGTWQVVEKWGGDIIPQETDPLIGSLATFSQDEIVFGDDVITDVQYAIKRVNTGDFFLYQYRVKAEDLGIDAENVDIISINSNNRLFYEMVKVDDSSIITSIGNDFYFLTKKSDDNEIISKDKKHTIDKDYTEDSSSETDVLRSGILLGLKRISIPDDGEYKVTYRTLWIRSENRELYPIFETSNLFTPRKTGFWEIGSNSEKLGGHIYEFIHAYPSFLYDHPNLDHELAADEPKKHVGLIGDGHWRRHIEYVGNDYIAVEDINIDKDASILDRRYKVLPIDNVQNTNGIKISDIAGQAGREALLSSAQSSIEIKDIKGAKILDDELDEENFTVARRNGHWIMRGRLSYNDEHDMVDFLDFNINIIPPTELVNYDELCISWNAIKAKLPSAVDAYTSPNEDMLIVLDIDNIYVYALEEEGISDRPIGKASLHEGEQVVMAEWATGVYVERWDKHFKGKKPIELSED